MSKEIFSKIINTDAGFSCSDSVGDLINYRVPIRTIRISIEEIRIAYSYNIIINKNINLQPRLSAIGVMEDDTVSVFGDDSSIGNKFIISIFQEETDNKSDSYSCFSYYKKDYETKTSSHWWLELYLNKELFNRIFESVSCASVSDLEIGLSSNNVYVNEFDWHSPPSSRVKFLVKPTESSCELVQCNLTYINLKLSNLIIGKVTPKDECVNADEIHGDDELTQAQWSSIDFDSLREKIMSKLDTISKNLSWIFWAIIFLSLVISSKS